MVSIKLEARDCVVLTGGGDGSPEQRGFQLRTVWITCPCGKTNPLFLTEGQHFQLPGGGPNVWHYSVSGNKITITPSIGLHSVEGHKPECHLTVMDQEFDWDFTGVEAS